MYIKVFHADASSYCGIPSIETIFTAILGNAETLTRIKRCLRSRYFLFLLAALPIMYVKVFHAGASSYCGIPSIETIFTAILGNAEIRTRIKRCLRRRDFLLALT